MTAQSEPLSTLLLPIFHNVVGATNSVKVQISSIGWYFRHPQDPLTPDQVSVPTEQGFGLDESPQTPAAKVSTQSGEQRSVRGPQHWADHLTTEHGNLVAEHDDLDRQLFVVVPGEADQFEDSDEGNVEKRQGHGPVSS
jgi:hypothetical protein